MIAAAVVVISRLQQILGKHIVRWNRHQYSNHTQADFTSSWAVFQVCMHTITPQYP